MEDAIYSSNLMMGAPFDSTMDFVNELLFDGCWLETTDGSEFLNPGQSTSTAFFDSPFADTAVLEPNNGDFSTEERSVSLLQEGRISVNPQIRQDIVDFEECCNQPWNHMAACSNPGPGTGTSVMQIKDFTVDKEVLVQLWVPVNRGGRRMLTTSEQAFSLNPNSLRLANYRDISVRYHFSAEENSNDVVGLPGRVNHAQQCDVRGTLAIPVFERGSRTCLGVIEVVMSTQKIQYRPELESVCKALEAVNLTSSIVSILDQLDKEQEALKNVPFTPSEASQHPSKPNASEGQRDCVTVGLDNAQTSQNVISRAVAEKGKTVFHETIPIDEGKLFSKRQFQVGMSFTTCGRTGNDNSPSWEKMLNFTYGADGSVKPNMAKPPSNSKAQCSSSHGYYRRMFGSQTITKERKPTWSKKNVREYLICPFTSEEENKLTAQRRFKPSGKTVTKVDIWDIKDKSLARLVCPLDNTITPDKLYIDDTVIDAYFYLLKKRCDMYPNKYLKHHSFSCFIASKLFSGQAEDLSTWFNPKDLKDACKLFLPLCLPNSSHWVLFCVDINNRQFLWLDSLENSRKSHESEMKVISEWFVERVLPHLDNKDARKWKSRVAEDIPSQENMVDCGVFVMKCADCLTHGDYFPFSQDDMPHFRRRIFLDIAEWSIRVPHRFISN